MSNLSGTADWRIQGRADNVSLAPRISEDWLSLIIGLLIFVLALGLTVGLDILGWAVTTSVWTDLGKALAPVSKAYAGLGGVAGSTDRDQLFAGFFELRGELRAGLSECGQSAGQLVALPNPLPALVEHNLQLFPEVDGGD